MAGLESGDLEARRAGELIAWGGAKRRPKRSQAIERKSAMAEAAERSVETCAAGRAGAHPYLPRLRSDPTEDLQDDDQMKAELPLRSNAGMKQMFYLTV
jgi:hypothetical protein